MRRVLAACMPLLACACAGAGHDPCAGVDCAGAGTCVVRSDVATCQCEAGFVARGLVCVDATSATPQPPASSHPCDPNPCVFGQCQVVTGAAVCTCEPGYAGSRCDLCADGFVADGLGCVPDELNPCDLDPCAPNACAPEACVSDPCTPNPCGEPLRNRCVVTGAVASCACSLGTTERFGACVPDCTLDADLCAAAKTWNAALVSANGHSAVVYDLAARKLSTFLEHPYRNWDDGVWTRDLLYDAYLGVRVGSAQAWLDQVQIDFAENLDQSGIIHIVQHVDGLRLDTYAWAPWELSRPALVLIGAVTNTGAAARDVSLFTLHNFHLGYTSSSDPVHPDAKGERIVATTSAALLETGAGGALLAQPLGTPTHHGFTPDNPWPALSTGLDLADNPDSGVGDDRVSGLQKDATLAPGASLWLGVVFAFERTGASIGLETELAAAFPDDDPETVLHAARVAWESWRKPPPPGLTPAELWAYRHAEATLRQAQVWEPADRSRGQILASLPPGAWNVSWVRDMAYATEALSRMGHLTEARAALEFVLEADAGAYQSQVNVPYQVSVTRYFGRGKEESDWNDFGPNIELDGFGLFLQALATYVETSGDGSLLETHAATLDAEVAGALTAIIDDELDLLPADSSIWEVHWNGQQKHFAYSSLAAAAGLCRYADVAAPGAPWREAGTRLRDGVLAELLASDGSLAGSREELLSGSGFRDAAVIEAINWQLISAHGHTATQTLAAIDSALATERGFARNDDGGWYDAQEWVFVGLRLSEALRRAGESQAADRLVNWITAQALANHGTFAELHHPVTGEYLGASPMVGFGAGAYALALWQRQSGDGAAPACGTWETP
jgi:hypothetical protein